MAGINKVILVGNLGADPEVRTLESGAKVARIRIATSESYTNKEGNKVETTEWHNVTLWRQQAELAEKYLSKGRQVYVEGKLQTRSWKDSEGNDRYATDIVAREIQFLGGRQEGSSPQPASSSAPSPATAQPADTSTGAESDDLPF